MTSIEVEPKLIDERAEFWFYFNRRHSRYHYDDDDDDNVYVTKSNVYERKPHTNLWSLNDQGFQASMISYFSSSPYEDYNRMKK